MTSAPLWLSTIQLIVLLGVCCLGPGLLIVQRMRWSPLEKLCGAFAASFVCVYLASFILFIVHADRGTCQMVSILFAIMGAVGWRTGRLFLRRGSSRRVLLAFGIVLLWELMHLAVVRSFDGGDWAVDWWEHYQRTYFFQSVRPMRFLFGGLYLLPSRPPMMNLIAAFFCKQAGMNFENFSAVFTFLNGWAFVPCCLLARRLFPGQKGAVTVLAVLFMLNPSILENATMTVTKALAAGLTILGVCFYLRALGGERGKRGDLIASGLSFSAAILTHFSAAPYAAAVGLHCLFRTALGRQNWRKVLAAAVAALGLLATWFIWSVRVYGVHDTFFSNTTAVGTADKTVAKNASKTLYNLFTTLVPHPFHSVKQLTFTRWRTLGQLDDYYFMMAQTTLPVMIGITGGLLAIGLSVRLLFQRNLLPRFRWFWVWFLLFSFFVGIAVNPDRQEYGCAQVTLQAMDMMGLALLAGWLMRLPLWTFIFLLIGLAVDCGIGVILHFYRETGIAEVVRLSGNRLAVRLNPLMGREGCGEFMSKAALRFVFWGDHLAQIGGILQLACLLGAIGAMGWLIRMRLQSQRVLQ